MPARFRDFIPIIPALIAYGLIAWWLNFTQDDAYISYRYVANFLNGHGLVYNIGERIEGFTNFGWVVYLILWGGLGVSFIAVSKLTGFLLGAATIIVVYLIAETLFEQEDKWFRYLPVYLLGANLSLAYWSPAGLETAAFTFFVSLALLWYVKRRWMLPFALFMAVWMRPEGAAVTALLILLEILTEKRVPFFTGTCAAIALILSLPFVGFKLIYYGSVLPNPFYAKTGVNLEYLMSGLDYAKEFFVHYGFLGLGLLIPLVLYRRLSTNARAIWWFVVGYTVYIVLIGGDVLKIHRFFLPVFGGSALLATLSIRLLVDRLQVKTQQLALILSALVLVSLTVYLPYEKVKGFNYMERAFTTKMAWLAKQLELSDVRPFSVATTTIGAFGYGMLGHDVIDMLGLTDSTIARHPEEPVRGIETTWKEQRHNSRYLLTREPDYICFSTGVKPSAPAEKTLMMYAQFLDSYRAIAWFYRNDTYDPRGTISGVFKKMRPLNGDLIPTYPVEFVEDYKRGQDAWMAGDLKSAVEWFEKGRVAVGSRKQYVELLWSLGYCMATLRDVRGIDVLDEAVALDSMAFGPHKDLYAYETNAGNTEKAAIHRAYLMKLVPWYVPRLDSLARMSAAKKR